MFNQGNQKRDVTFIDDIVNGINQVFKYKEKIERAEILDIDQGKPINLGELICQMEKSTQTVLI